MKHIAPRIHVLLASESTTAVIIRRGPSKAVCTIGWDRTNDRFTLGQWFKGRIYERRSDLSPDGKHMIYFAMNGKWDQPGGGSWTAISRAPYLKAIAFHSKGDCWFGGGLFLDNHRYWLNGGDVRGTLRASHLKIELDYRPPTSYGGECPGVYYHRLQRDGWTYRGPADPSKKRSPDVFDKNLPCGWTLRKLANAGLNQPPGRGVYFDEHELFQPLGRNHIKLPAWEWAELDRRRVVWAADGKVFAAKINEDGLFAEKELFDSTGMKFEPIEPPY